MVPVQVYDEASHYQNRKKPLSEGREEHPGGDLTCLVQDSNHTREFLVGKDIWSTCLDLFGDSPEFDNCSARIDLLTIWTFKISERVGKVEYPRLR